MSDFMTLIDQLCQTEVARYGAEIDSQDPVRRRAARLYYALASVRALAQHALPDGVYAELEAEVSKFKSVK